MVGLFGCASFLGAALLFLSEPMLAKLVLPYFGGSPMVWNTCTLFFQVLLLLGYLYVHVSTRRLGRRRQPWLHLGLLVLPLLVLPVALPADAAPPPDAEPTVWLLRVLTVAIGLPFALLATTGPLLQRWFSWSGHRRAADPYFLYSASNAGSVVGLLGYPFVIEPTVGLSAQARWWSVAYLAFVGLVVACGLVTRRRARGGAAPAEAAEPEEEREEEPGPAVSRRTRLGWLGLAFIPSSLMLGLSTHVSTDIAPIPLFWTVPLAVYLATFVVAFARTSRTPMRWTGVLAAALAFPVLLAVLDVWRPAVWLTIVMETTLLALTGLAAHSRLAAGRPAASGLTGFYLLISLGGAAGGLLNGFVAPVVLDRVLEYPVVLALVPLLVLGAVPGSTRTAARPLVREPVAWVALALVSVTLLYAFAPRGVIHRDRTFYGSYRITGSSDVHFLLHGTTTHGYEVRSGRDEGEPTSYYSRGGPIGDVLTTYQAVGRLDRVAVIGMGVGTLAAYGRPGERMDFFEIDPAVVRIAEDDRYFRYLSRSAADIHVTVGDGRLRMQQVDDSTYDLVVLDAFSSDAIPAHLLTAEALEVYRSKLAPGGILAVHITNRHLSLAPMLAAQSAELGLVAVDRYDQEGRPLASPSHWVALARDAADLEPLLERPGWARLAAGDTRAWTDDYSSLVQVLDVGWP